ncbi:Muramidase-2 [Anaerolineae bacterium]|nr:Muramidase-2 [Anaerolineae bacterium]
MRRILTSMLCCCMLLLVGLRVSIVEAQSDAAQELLRLVNDYRASNGMPPLTANSALMTAAQRHADWQAANNIHSHQGEGGSMPQDRATAAGYSGFVSENAASGTIGYATPAWAVQGWAGSYIHRITMLSQNVHIGVGVAENREEAYYVLLVGSPSSYAPQSPIGETAETLEEDSEAQSVMIVVPIVIAAPNADGSIVHVVQEGQTVWAIASRYGVPLDEVLTINHLDRNTLLHPGDEIIIRLGEGQSPPPAPTLPVTHIVQDGESLWTIAVTHGLSLDELLALNGLTRSSIIKAGDEVRLRVPEPSPTFTPTPTLFIPTVTATISTPTPSPTATIVTATAIAMIIPLTAPTALTSSSLKKDTESENADFTGILILSGIAVGSAMLGALSLLGGAAVLIRKRRAR